MSTAPVTNNYVNGVNPALLDGSTRLPTKTLNQDDFLKLLVAQLSSQDPMNPQSNSDFAAQMAQFSALQASQSTSTELGRLRADQQVLQANTLIGRNVTLDNGNGTTSSGTVAGVQVAGNVPRLMVNGVAYDLSQVLTIETGQPVLSPTQSNP